MSVAEGFEEFVAVVDCGSVTGAAELLGQPRATLSRRLSRLEARLGVRLLHRTTRRLKLTAHGEVLYGKARRVVDAAQEADAAVRRLDGVPRGLLRVSTPMGLPGAMFAAWLADFLATYPDLRVEVVATSVHVDLIADGFDVALRTGPIEDPNLIVRRVTQARLLAVASPTYLKRRGTPTTAQDLMAHDCICAFRAGTVAERQWPLREGGSIEVSSLLSTNQMQLRLAAARRHLGIALVAEVTAAAALDAGELVAVLEPIIGTQERVSLVYADRTFLDPKVRAFVDFMVKRLEAAKAAGPRPELTAT